MNRKVYFVKKVSKKDGKQDFVYVQLYVDLGYAKRVISMDCNLIAELLNKPVGDLYSAELNKENYVGDFSLKEVK